MQIAIHFMRLSMKKISFLSPGRGRLFLGIVLILAAYGPVLTGHFVWDDQNNFEWNQMARQFSLGNIVRIFKSTVCDIYIPLTILSFSLEHLFFQENPIVYHLDNLLLHIGVVCLVYKFALQLGASARAAGAAALIFGLHPIHVEPVAWMSARKDVLYAFFYMLALVQYMNFIRTGERRPYYAAILFGFLGMLSKPMAVSLPLALLVCDWFRGRRLCGKVLKEKIPFVLYAVPVAWITYRLNMGGSPGSPVSVNILLWLWSFVFYVYKFFLPVHLSPLYFYPLPVSWTHVPYFLSLLACALLVLFLLTKNCNKWLHFSFLFYLVSIFFLLRTDPVSSGLNPVADRFMYLPCLGFCILCGILYERLASATASHRIQRISLNVAAVFIIGGMALGTFQQSRVWNNGYSLWGFVLRHAPRHPVAHYNLGLAYLKDGKKEPAKRHFLDAALFQSENFRNYNNLGNIFYEERDLKRAKVFYEQALRLNPEYAQANSNYGVLLMEEGQYELSEKYLLKARALDSRDPETLKNLGNFYVLQNKPEQAREMYLQALAGQPDSLYIHSVLGDLYMKQGALEKARKHFSEILIYHPDNALVHNSVGAIYMKQGETVHAVYHFQEALRIDPRYESAQKNLAIVLAQEDRHF